MHVCGDHCFLHTRMCGADRRILYSAVDTANRARAFVRIYLCCRYDAEIVQVITTNAGDTLVYANGTTLVLPPCPHQPRRSMSTNDSDTARTPPSSVPAAPATARPGSGGEGSESGYYSGWVAYTESTAPSGGYIAMASAWDVPGKPASQGPAPPLISSSIYLFNGLEDGGGVPGKASLILQPVLSYVK